jgi:hypothetical protein
VGEGLEDRLGLVEPVGLAKQVAERDCGIGVAGVEFERAAQ